MPFGRGPTTLLRGQKLTIVINHLLRWSSKQLAHLGMKSPKARHFTQRQDISLYAACQMNLWPRPSQLLAIPSGHSSSQPWTKEWKKDTNFPHTKFLGSAPELLLQKRFEAIFTLASGKIGARMPWETSRGTKAMENASKKNVRADSNKGRIPHLQCKHSACKNGEEPGYFSDVHLLCFLWPSRLAAKPIWEHKM